MALEYIHSLCNIGMYLTALLLFNRFMDNSTTNQLADRPTCRQSNSPTTNSPTDQLADKLAEIAIIVYGSRRNVIETMKVALFRSSLECSGGINVRSFILNVSQLIGVKYETRSGRKRSMQNTSICLLYLPVK